MNKHSLGLFSVCINNDRPIFYHSEPTAIQERGGARGMVRVPHGRAHHIQERQRGRRAHQVHAAGRAWLRGGAVQCGLYTGSGGCRVLPAK